MAINLYSLNLSEATIVKSNNKKQSYKLNNNQIKDTIDKQQLKTNNNLSINKDIQSKINNLSHIGTLDTTTINYSSEILLQKSTPKANADGNYIINGVSFTAKELEQSKAVLKVAQDSIDCGIGKNINIDYKNYAQMGIAIGNVKNYSSKNLNEEQANVLNTAIQEYTNALIDLEKDLFSNGNYVDSNYSGLSDYYNKAYVLNDTEIEAINNLKKELNKITGQNYSPTKKGATSGVPSATNQELINKITDLFSNVDYNDQKSINSAIEKYKELMKPAYNAYGLNNSHGSLDRVLNNDVTNFKNQILNFSMIMNYHKTDFSI